jgi:dGTPase
VVSGQATQPVPGTIRQALEDIESRVLAPYACRAAESRGRARPEPEHPYRTAFQRDRDRILHTKAFRRLKGKTQVFLAPQGDHYRTRMTHTLEVAQIARTAARALSLNEDLTEAIAYGHDLGHTPFGHAGEAVLNDLFPGGFRHYEQSLRVVDVLETTRGGRGLNLTHEVRDGILRHSTGKAMLLGSQGERAETLEGQVVSLCDAIAYVNHDIDDAIRAGIISHDHLPADAVAVVGRSSSERIDRMVTALITGSAGGRIAIEEQVRAAIVALRRYLFANVYPHPAINEEILKAKRIVRELYFFLIKNPNRLPEDGATGPVERRVADFLAGMTDSYALRLYRENFFPEAGQP